MSMPRYPWKKGTHEDYECLVIEVEICRDAIKQVYSSHRPQTQADQDLAMTWPGGGQEHIAFALLTEAARREAILALLMNMTHHQGFLAQLQGMEPEHLDAKLAEITESVLSLMGKLAQEIMPEVVRGAYESMVRPD